jgi:hypothetical protein
LSCALDFGCPLGDLVGSNFGDSYASHTRAIGLSQSLETPGGATKKWRWRKARLTSYGTMRKHGVPVAVAKRNKAAKMTVSNFVVVYRAH